MTRFARPIVVVSRCLGLAACRYDGAIVPSPLVDRLRAYADLRPVCPELELGLGVPREPIRIVQDAGGLRLVQPATHRDLTAPMASLVAAFLAAVPDVDGFILKSRSPSCALRDARIYESPSAASPLAQGAGFLGREVLECFEGLPVEDERRLLLGPVWEHFLMQLFTLAHFRAAQATGSLAELERFHAVNKLLLLTCNQHEYRLLGPLLANHAHLPFEVLAADYRAHLRLALRRAPGRGAHINTLLHAFGYFSAQLTPIEKSSYLAFLERYRAQAISLGDARAPLWAWIRHYDEPYLRQQTYFEPYPADLNETAPVKPEEEGSPCPGSRSMR